MLNFWLLLYQICVSVLRSVYRSTRSHKNTMLNKYFHLYLISNNSVYTEKKIGQFYSIIEFCSCLQNVSFAFAKYSCIRQVLMHSPSTHAFAKYSCIHQVLMHSPSSHAFAKYSCIRQVLMHSPSTHAFAI